MPPKSQVLCSFHRTGSCTKGEQCPFSHGQHPTPPVICKHYRAGTCMFGDQCRKSHDIPQLKATSPCIFWNKGSCAKGDECKFIHEPRTRTSDSITWRTRTTLSVPLVDVKPTVEQTPCVFWKSGRCSKGTQCEYLHVPPGLEPSENPQGSHRTAFGRSLGSRPGDRMETEKQTTFVKLPMVEDSPFDEPSSSDSAVHPPGSLDLIPDEQTLRDYSHSEPAVERSFLDGVHALIGPGGIVKKVVTAFESTRVTLSNVPEDTSQQEMITLTETFGPLKSIVLAVLAPGTKMTAKLEYLDPESATTAAETLDGYELHSRRLTAQLDLRSGGRHIADLRSSTLKMSWFAPARMAYAHYGSIYEAKSKASKLNGNIFSGRTVAAIFQTPSRNQLMNFTVILKNLPLHLQIEDLKKFCQSSSVDLSQATYHGKEGIAEVQRLLETFGPLENFDRSNASPNDVKVKALARFVKPEHAAAAEKELQGKGQTFLGGAKTWITLLHSIKYNIPRAQYRILKNDLHRLQGDAQQAKVKVYDKDEQGRSADPVSIRIYGDDPKILGQLKMRMDKLVLGEEVFDEGTILWDNYFSSNRSKTFIDDVQSISEAFIRVDSRRRRLRVSGSPPQKDSAHQLLALKVRELQSQRHQIPLKKVELGRLLRGEFTRLQGVLGEDKVSLDIRQRVLIIRGGEEDIETARLSLSTVETNPGLPADQGVQTADCPVCFCEVTTPVTLSCGHNYCFGCLRHYLASADTFPVKCLAQDGQCELPIPLSTICRLLPAGDEAKFFEDAFLAYIHQHPQEYHYCPSVDCQQIYRPAAAGNVLRCPSCLSRICPSCHIEFHEGQTCAEHRYNESGEEQAYQRWKEANGVQACPNCKADIEKSEGCNHMTCTFCRTHMCWVCRATFPGPSGEGIYEHMRIMHGGIGL